MNDLSVVDTVVIPSPSKLSTIARLIDDHEQEVKGRRRVRRRGKIQVSPLSSIRVSKLTRANYPYETLVEDGGASKLSLLVNEGGSGRMALTLRWLIHELMVSHAPLSPSPPSLSCHQSCDPIITSGSHDEPHGRIPRQRYGHGTMGLVKDEGSRERTAHGKTRA